MKKKKRKNAKRKEYNTLNVIITWVFIIVILILLIILFINLLPKNQELTDANPYNVNNTTREYMRYDDKVIYLANLEELKVNYEGEEISLKNYIEKFANIEDAFKDMESNLEIKTTLKDGGTIIYNSKDDNKLFDEKITIIRCHTEEGNGDVYFGKNMNTTIAFKNGACGKNFFEDKEFTRVYKITKIKELKKEDDKYYLELTVSDDNNAKVTINKYLSEDMRGVLSEGNKYTFYFTNKYGELIKDDIEEIFAKAELTSVVLYKD